MRGFHRKKSDQEITYESSDSKANSMLFMSTKTKVIQKDKSSVNEAQNVSISLSDISNQLCLHCKYLSIYIV